MEISTRAKCIFYDLQPVSRSQLDSFRFSDNRTRCFSPRSSRSRKLLLDVQARKATDLALQLYEKAESRPRQCSPEGSEPKGRSSRSWPQCCTSTPAHAPSLLTKEFHSHRGAPDQSPADSKIPLDATVQLLQAATAAAARASATQLTMALHEVHA